MSLQNTINRALAPVVRRLRLMVSKGVVELVNDGLKMQGLQVSLLSDELSDDVERFQDYGITSVPFTGAEVLFLSVGANRSHGVVVSVADRRYRPKDLVEGDVCLYTDKGERVYLNRVDDIVHLGAKSAADFVALAADTKSEISAVRDTLDNFITAHKAVGAHTTTGTVGPSGVPGIVTSAIGVAPAAVGDVAAIKVKAT